MTNPHEQHRHHGGEPVTGRRVGSGEARPRQDDAAEPYVEHPHLPRMDDNDAAPPPSRSNRRLMDEPAAPTAATPGRGEMTPVPDNLNALSHEDEYPPQRPTAATESAAEPGGYLRLQMRVDDGDMSLVGVSRVAGPLDPPAPLHGGFAYEVSLGQQQLGAGDVPDPGVRRGLVPPDDPQRGHFVTDVPSFEFTARIPAERLTAVNLPDLNVAVYRIDSGQVIHPNAERPLRSHAGRLAEEIATLRGIHTDQLPDDVRIRIQQAMR